MKLTRKTHYSVKALLDLSLETNKKANSVQSISIRQNLPAPYLEKLLIKMRKAGIVLSIRGVYGGYQLALPLTEISLGNILEAIGEKIEPLSGYNFDQNCAEDWVTFTLWEKVNQRLKESLYNITLADLYYDVRSRKASMGESPNFMV